MGWSFAAAVNLTSTASASWTEAGSLHLGAPGYWLAGAAVLVTLGYARRMRRQARIQASTGAHERRLREELEAYAQLDVSVGLSSDRRQTDAVTAGKALAARVCRTIAQKSRFRRVMLLLRDGEGRLRSAGSIGIDDLTAAALERWGAEVADDGSADPGAHGNRAGEAQNLLIKNGSGGRASLPIALGEWHHFDRELSTWEMSGRRERRKHRRGIVVPIRTGAGRSSGHSASHNPDRLVGAIVVCSDGLSIPIDGPRQGHIDQVMGPLETLASRLGASLENEALADRLLRAQKLAGLGQLAGGVAHALSNPLTAVLGYAELIAETSSEPRVQEDARAISTEALRMRETVARLQDFWRPSTLADGPVDLLRLVRDTARGCTGELADRGVKLEVLAPDELDTIRGSYERLAQVLEHLLKNAAHAISQARPREEGEQHSIRISVSRDGETIFLIVSDTGAGFREPGRAFDPFYTTRDAIEGAGLGLSICYGIVREHGGEIAAFNLHPHGAAVVVELPLSPAQQHDTPRVLEKKLSALTSQLPMKTGTDD